MKKVVFTASATKPNIVIEVPELIEQDLLTIGHTSDVQPKFIVARYSQLRMKKDWELTGSSFNDGVGGNGSVTAFSVMGEEDDPNPMKAIEGDGSPLSYIQAAMLYRDFDEYGRFWHSTQWAVETVLDDDLAEENNLFIDPDEMEYDPSMWTFITQVPTSYNPVYEENADTIVITYYSINPVMTETLYFNTHSFKKGSFVQELRVEEIATGQGGIIF